jgi:hypothetical protein
MTSTPTGSNTDEPLARRLAVEDGTLLRFRPAVVGAALGARFVHARAYALWPHVEQPLVMVDVGCPRAAAWLRETLESPARTRRFPGAATWNALRARGLLLGRPGRLALDAAERALGRPLRRPRLAIYSPTGARDSKATAFVFERGEQLPSVVVKMMPDSRFASRLRFETESVEALRRSLHAPEVEQALPLSPLYAGELNGDYVVAQPLDPLASATAAQAREPSLVWLRSFHEATTTGVDPWTSADDHRELELVRDAWERAHPERAAAVVSRVSELLASLHGLPVRRCAMHGDFWRGNIAFDGGRIRVYDWEWFQPGQPPFFDLWLYELGELRRLAQERPAGLDEGLAAALERVRAEVETGAHDPRFALATLAPSIALISFRERRATGLPGSGEEGSIRVMVASEKLVLDGG